MAVEKPTAEFQNLMKSNGAIIDVTLGTIGSVSGAGTGQEGRTSSLRTHIKTKDYVGIAADAAMLKANFARIGAFWMERKMDDAVNLSRAGVKAATDLEMAAKVMDDAAIASSANAVAGTCRECHQAHRVMQITDRSYQIQ
jgi:hypothetical protein